MASNEGQFPFDDVIIIFTTYPCICHQDNSVAALEEVKCDGIESTQWGQVTFESGQESHIENAFMKLCSRPAEVKIDPL